MSVTILGHCVDFLVGQNLHVLATGSTVKLVGPDESTADQVRHLTLLTHMLCKIRRGLNGYLSEIKYHIINTCTNCLIIRSYGPINYTALQYNPLK